MSKENFIKLFEAAASDQTLAAHLQGTRDYDELKSLAAKHGFSLEELPEADARRIFSELSAAEGQQEAADEELSDQDLEAISGGAGRRLAKINLFKSSFLGSAIPGTAIPGTAIPGRAIPGTSIPGTSMPRGSN